MARLLFVSSLADARLAKSSEQYSPTLICQMRDISLTGLALVVPLIRSGDANFYGLEGTLKITLGLPSGALTVEAVPARYEWLREDDRGEGFLIGAHITSVSGDGRERFSDYLRQG